MYDDPSAEPTPNRSIGSDDREAPWSAAPARPIAADVAHPTSSGVCPFLVAVDDADRVEPALDRPDPVNRCAAMQEPVPQSLRQQELVCLTSGHVNCPRYLRGSMGAAEPPVRVKGEVSVRVTPATAGALVVFALAFVLSLGFVVANGGLVLSAAAPTAGPSGGVLGEVETAPALDGAGRDPDARAHTGAHADPDRHALADPERIADAQRDARLRRRALARARPPHRPRSRPRAATRCSTRARTGRTAGPIASVRATTCTASRSTTACRSARSEPGTRGSGTGW